VVRGRFATAYTPKPYRTWQEEAAKQLALIASDGPFTGPVLVALAFGVLKPKTSKLTHPRPDIDNYEKSILDALTKDGRFWLDDSQVVGLSSHKMWADNTGHQISIVAL
jgi:Holliday junction resolvase RusA-like endonuclease